jgi:hypothetical protein
VVARMIRSSLLEVLNEDYIRTARAKGVFEKMVISRHALRNALLPAITVIGIEFAFLIGGLVVTEQVFNLNGIGMLFVQSVSRNDFTLIQALVMLVAGPTWSSTLSSTCFMRCSIRASGTRKCRSQPSHPPRRAAPAQRDPRLLHPAAAWRRQLRHHLRDDVRRHLRRIRRAL